MSVDDEEERAAAFRLQEADRAVFRRRRALEMRGTASAAALRDRIHTVDRSIDVTPESETDCPTPK